MADDSRGHNQSWSDATSARERVQSVAETLREPRSINWISEQADVAWSTANETLEDLREQGRLQRIDSDDATRYQPDRTQLFFDEIRTLIEENTREELRSELAAITAEIEGWQETYGVDSWEALEQTLADEGLSSAESSERRDVVTFWRENEADRQLLKHALALYTDVEAAREGMRTMAERARS
ncbi:hypothetical protein [Halorhabdus sp. BNX81]|uniref:DUF7342 family protein n=1 Tax=Halorhabdus sp. BNX81 TaxID=2980181 RepID=UPI0023DCF23C|nr:hypothetical protein [Halorhabdus sp. BNX81]WEL20301.1 HTH-domain containing transcriptional regulator [Halorhabdus sp. BNX81]